MAASVRRAGSTAAETLDYERMALVVRGLFVVIDSLACGESCPL
jgi:hypothetical protein